MTIDSHLHLWVNDPDRYPWHPIGGYIPEEEALLSDYLDVMRHNKINGAVLVQPTPYGWDNAFLLDCKKTNPEIFKAVVLVDPLTESASETLQDLVHQGADGLRINLQLNPVKEWQHKNFYRLIEACAYLQFPVCVQLTPLYLDFLSDLSRKYPVNFIVDHLGRPEPGVKHDQEKFQKLLGLSEQSNVFIKISGMNYYSKGPAPYSDTWELLRAVGTHFGADHCLWGSDYPFVQQHWSFEKNVNLFYEEQIFNENELEFILEKTARSLWWNSPTDTVARDVRFDEKR